MSGTVAASNPNNPFNIEVTARNRFLEFPRRYQTDTTLWRGVAGIRGDIVGSWKYEVAGNWNRAQSQFRNPGLIDGAAYSRAVANGTYNPFARQQAPGVLESFVGIQFRDYESTLYSFDAKVFGDVFSLPAGMVQLAVGADTRDETLDYKNDKMDQTGGWLQATPTQPFSADLSSPGYFRRSAHSGVLAGLQRPGLLCPGVLARRPPGGLRHHGRPVRAEVHHALAAVR